ncbi:MAG: PIN domain-containing protein, partial [Candidatus Hermodarchaeota archaeon]
DEVKKAHESTDDFLLRWCINFKKEFKRVFLATNDSDLRRKAKNSKVSVIFLRQGKYLFIERV